VPSCPASEAATSGFRLALVAGGILLVATAFIALRATNTRGEPTSEITGVLVDSVTRDAAGSQRIEPGVPERGAAS
jgi:hypothetical protein